eukprot:1145847-Pelagomonas_calceolata.AAC.7
MQAASTVETFHQVSRFKSQSYPYQVSLLPVHSPTSRPPSPQPTLTFILMTSYVHEDDPGSLLPALRQNPPRLATSKAADPARNHPALPTVRVHAARPMRLAADTNDVNEWEDERQVPTSGT